MLDANSPMGAFAAMRRTRLERGLRRGYQSTDRPLRTQQAQSYAVGLRRFGQLTCQIGKSTRFRLPSGDQPGKPAARRLESLSPCDSAAWAAGD
jgi:hypothetical protein